MKAFINGSFTTHKQHGTTRTHRQLVYAVCTRHDTRRHESTTTWITLRVHVTITWSDLGVSWHRYSATPLTVPWYIATNIRHVTRFVQVLLQIVQFINTHKLQLTLRRMHAVTVNITTDACGYSSHHDICMQLQLTSRRMHAAAVNITCTCYRECSGWDFYVMTENIVHVHTRFVHAHAKTLTHLYQEV